VKSKCERAVTVSASISGTLFSDVTTVIASHLVIAALLVSLSSRLLDVEVLGSFFIRLK